MRIISILLFLTAFLILTVGSGTGKLIAQTDVELKPTEVFDRIPNMRTNVQKNMVKCEESLAKITNAIVRGDYEAIQEEALNINNKYGIESGLSPDDQMEYYNMVPSDFLFLDQDLHQYLEALYEAAKANVLEETLVKHDLTVRSCVNCHYDFAKEKFPSLAKSVIDF